MSGTGSSASAVSHVESALHMFGLPAEFYAALAPHLQISALKDTTGPAVVVRGSVLVDNGASVKVVERNNVIGIRALFGFKDKDEEKATRRGDGEGVLLSRELIQRIFGVEETREILSRDVWKRYVTEELRKEREGSAVVDEVVEGEPDDVRDTLHETAKAQNVPVATIVSRAGFNGYTLLHHLCAVDHPRLDVLHMLIGFGADVNAATDDGVRPIHLAINSDVEEHITMLVNNGAVASHAARNSEGLSPILLAAALGRVNLMRLLINLDPSNVDTLLNGTDELGHRALFNAAMTGKRPPVEYLLDLGCRVNAANPSDGQTALHAAVAAESTSVVEYLLAHGADVAAVDKHIKCPLHYAAAEGNNWAVGALCEAGADPNVCDEDGRTPLHAAAYFGNHDVIFTLLRFGADRTIRADDGRAPVDLARLHGDRSCIESLAFVRNPPRVFELIYENDLQGLTALLTAKPDAVASTFPKSKWSAIHEASVLGDHLDDEHGHSHVGVLILKTLLQRGADLFALTDNNQTALMLAARNALTENVEAILQHLDNKLGRGPAHSQQQTPAPASPSRSFSNSSSSAAAAASPSRSPSKAINELNPLANFVNAVDSSKRSALHYACKARDLKSIKLLLDHGATTGHMDIFGFYPKNYLHDHPEDLAIFAAYSRPPEHLVGHEAVRDRNLAALKTLPRHYVDAPDENGMTPLHWAGYLDWDEGADYLASKGAAVDFTYCNGHTALHLACSVLASSTVRVLLGRGAHPNLATDAGMTPMLMAIQSAANRPEESLLSIINDLLRAGCNINQQEPNGKNTALHLEIAGRKRTNVIRALLAAKPKLNIANSKGLSVSAAIDSLPGELAVLLKSLTLN